MRPRLLDDVLLVMYASDTFEQALGHFLRFQRLLSGGFRAGLERRGDTSRLVIDIDYPGFGPLRQQAECLAPLLGKLFALLTDDAFAPTAVAFRHGAPGRAGSTDACSAWTRPSAAPTTASAFPAPCWRGPR